MEIGQAFQSFVTDLEKNQVEYDLGSENIIKDHGVVENGKFVIGQTSYSMVVLPPMMETLNMLTFDLLQKFVEKGGQLICFSTPNRLDGAEDSKLSELLSAQFVISVPTLTKEVIQKYFENKDCLFTFTGGDLYHQRREFADGELLFLVNSSMNEVTRGTVLLKGKSVLKLDAMQGKIYEYPVDQKEENLSVHFELEPAGSLLLYCSHKTMNGYAKEPVLAGNTKLRPEGDLQIKRLRENALTIDFCDVTIKGKTIKNVYFAQAADAAFREYGFVNGNPWNTSVQYKRNILDRDTFTTGGFTTSYHFTVKDKFDYSTMKLVAERPEIFKVKINGETLSATPGAWWLDRSFGVYSIGDKVKQGINTIEMSVSPMSIYAEIEPLYVIGDFSVVPEKKGWSITTPVEKLTLGSWKEQKQPFYSWEVSYTKEYKIDDINRPYAVQLNAWKGTVAEVYVNDVKAGIIAFDPYRLDITSLLKQGKNIIEVRVIGSHKNLLGPHYNNPAPGLASPWHWKNIKQQIPGNEYQMCDYGLMEDFDVVE